MASRYDTKEFLKHIDDLKNDEFRDICLVLQGKRAVPSPLILAISISIAERHTGTSSKLLRDN